MEAGPGECGQLRASNVFLLTSTGRDKLFPQGRCFLSAETLTEMRGWVADIRRLLGSGLCSGIAVADKNSSSKIAHILSREGNDKSRSGSFDTLQSVKTQSYLHPSFPAQTSGRPVVQKSASPQWRGHTSPGPGVLGLAEADTHNLTYSYSSDDDEARPEDLVTCPRSPRSVDTCLRRRVLDKTKHLAFIDSSEEDLSRLEESNSYKSLLKMMETVQQQSENLGESGLQDRMEAVTQTVQGLATQAAGVIQVRSLGSGSRDLKIISTMLHPHSPLL